MTSSTLDANVPSLRDVLHTHTQHGVAVAAQVGGLLPISQQATLVLGRLAGCRPATTAR